MVGTSLVTLSLVLLSWGVWETAGSAWWAARGQQARAEQFDELQAAAASRAPVFAPGDSLGGVVVPLLPSHGEIAGRLLIPALDIDEVVSVGTDDGMLRSGPGLWEAGVFPGAPGNSTIAGHRTTYGGPFRHIDKLNVGDRIIFETPGRAPAVFEVRGSRIVHPSQVSVTDQGAGVRLTLTTCHPVASAQERLIVQAELVEGEFVTAALPRDQWEFRGA
jgi:LPXTG-site transpeptidase (sortase) family protein